MYAGKKGTVSWTLDKMRLLENVSGRKKPHLKQLGYEFSKIIKYWHWKGSSQGWYGDKISTIHFLTCGIQ